MTTAPPTSERLRDPRRPALVEPVGVWLLIQLIALLLAVLRVPLSARFPQPAESLALHEMLVAQVIGSVLLAPILLRGTTRAAIILLTTLPFIQLSAFLAAVPSERAAICATYLAIWMLALALWINAFPSRRGGLLIVTIASALALGPIILWYVHAEFSPVAATMDWPTWGAVSPVLGALAPLAEEHVSWPPFASLIGLCAVGGIVMRLRQRRHTPGG